VQGMSQQSAELVYSALHNA